MTSQARLVGGRYEEGESLGRGGMADVRQGVDNRLGRTVAIKRLRVDLASDSTFQARFRREAQSAASLNHPSIVAVYDTGEEPDPNGSGITIPYIVMEYVAGKTLRDLLREGRRILPERALEITSGVLEALDYSHRAGIVHRDIKPGNVMMTPHGQVKVMDFGIARAVADTSATMTQTAAVIGTAQYLSPEQARGESVDARSDLYSTGCLLYELLTGRPPFVGESPVSVAYQHVREEPVPPSGLDPEIPPEVDAVVLRALAKNREYRYQSASEMRADIHRVLSGQQVTAPIAAVAETRIVPNSAATMGMNNPGGTALAPAAHRYDDGPGDDEPPRNGNRARGIGYFLLGLAIVALAVGGYFLWDSLSDNDTTANQVEVPSLIGKSAKDATALLAENGLQLGTPTYEVNESQQVGRILSQDPGALTMAPRGTKVNVVISRGKQTFPVPDVIGDNIADARDKMDKAGFDIETKDKESDEPEGTVVEVTPSPDKEYPKGTLFTLFVSAGKAEVEVPDVTQLTRVDAERTLKQAGFTVGLKEEETDEAVAGTVLSQNPKGGSKAKKGSKVTIVIAKEKDETTPPTTRPTDTGTTPTLPTLPTTPPEGENASGAGER